MVVCWDFVLRLISWSSSVMVMDAFSEWITGLSLSC